MSYDVFISYASEDKPIADGVCATLERNGLRCWIAPRDILPGSDWSASIVQALEEVRVFVLVLSKSANASNQIKREVERAVHNGLPLIPYRIEDVQPTQTLEYFIATPHWLDAFSPPVERHAQDLADAIRRLLGSAPTPGDTPPAPPLAAPLASPPPPAAPIQTVARGGPPMALLAGGAVAVLALVVVGVWLLMPKPPPQPTPPAPGQASAAAPTLVGSWTVGQVSWNPNVASGYDIGTLGELFAGVMHDNATKGTFNVTPAGTFTTVVEVDDYGVVTPLDGGFVFSSRAHHATAVVTARHYASGIPLGGQFGDAGLILKGSGARIANSWVGLADSTARGPLGVIAGRWSNGTWPMASDGETLSARLTINAQGAYNLQLFQSVGGTFTFSGGQWHSSGQGPGGAPTSNGGSYVFNGPNSATVSSQQGWTTWVRQN